MTTAKCRAGGETGEVWLKGPMIMKGYHNLPKETAAALDGRRIFQDAAIWGTSIPTDFCTSPAGRKI